MGKKDEVEKIGKKNESAKTKDEYKVIDAKDKKAKKLKKNKKFKQKLTKAGMSKKLKVK